MAASLVKVNGTEVSVEDSGRTVVNVNICQESSLAYLVKAVAAAGQKWHRQKAPASKTPEASALAPGRAPCTGEQKVLGAVQILLGLACLGLGGVLCLLYSYLPSIESGAPFWMGSLFVVSGSLCVLSERRGGCCWVLLATFFNLVSVVTGCVGLALGVARVSYTPYWVEEECRMGGGDGGDYGSWRPTKSPNDVWREQACKDQMKNLLDILCGVQVLLLIFSVAALGIAAFCFGYGLRTLCCRWKANSEEDYVLIGDPEVPHPQVPPPYEEPSKENTIA